MPLKRLLAGTLAFIFFVFTSGELQAQEPLPLSPCNADDPEDICRWPQTITPYLHNTHERPTLLPVQREYKTAYYRVWQRDYRPDPLKKVKWPFEVYGPEDAYGANLRPLPQSWFYAMMCEADWQHYDQVAAPAIALRRLDLRNFPTASPLFHDPCKAGEGFPFDYGQNSTVFANEPLYLSHFSKSGEWAYVLTSYATGWVRTDAVALIDANTAHRWQQRPLLALLRDHAALHTPENRYLFNADIGMLLPLQRRTSKAYRTDAAVCGDNGSVTLRYATVSTADAAPAPMRFTADALERIIAPILDTRYGWGGLFGERDCSSTLRDIFAPLGIWLPRNSFQQASIGRVKSLGGLPDADKIEMIKREGKPFETLLYLPGHILLYLGLYHGEPAVLHTIWGIKTVEQDGSFGRYIVGKTVISSLRLGRELKGYREENSLLRKLESMNFVLEPADTTE